MPIPQRIRWLMRWHKLQRSIPGLAIHPTATSDEHCAFENHVRIAAGVKFHYASIGRYSYVAARARVAYSNIGRFVSIGPEAMIGGLGKHPVRSFSTHPYFYSKSYRRKLGLEGGADFDELPTTRVGNDVWIGARAIILDGLSIGDGAIVAANAVVTRDVPSYAIVGGIPARRIGERTTTPAMLGERPDWWNSDPAELEAIFARTIGYFAS